jgi:hypothetical protein
VDPVWLAELGPMFFSLKTNVSDAIDAKSESKAMARQMELEFERKLEEEKTLANDQAKARLEERTAMGSQKVAMFGRKK